MTTVFDFYKGTEYIYLHECDFKDKSRYEHYVKFLGYDGLPDVIRVPIDAERMLKMNGKRDTRTPISRKTEYTLSAISGAFFE